MSRSGLSAAVVLPSYLRQKRNSEGRKTVNISKRPKQVQCSDRDIVCLPDEFGLSFIPYPRGKYQTKLGASGLIGKVRLLSSMMVEEVEDEVRSVFKKPMGGKEGLYVRDGANSARDILEKYKALSRLAMVSAIIRVALVGVITLEYNMH